MERWAKFSEDGLYRYTLGRRWSDKPLVGFIGLNPSTADEDNDDPTIRRCINYAKDWGYGGLIMLNLFAFRSTDPTKLYTVQDPIGPDNNFWITHYSTINSIDLVAAWGTRGSLMNQDIAIALKCPLLHYLEISKHGHPKHPLYLKKNLKPIVWDWSRNA